jgi:DNA invertase Pin-like site-specific DNA recombinase
LSIIGYCRVSTRKQKDGYGLEAQESEILEKYENATICKEQFSAKTLDRPIFNEITKEILKSGDTLVVAKLDRLARNTVEGINIVKDLFEKNIAIHVLNVGLLENTNMGRFFIAVMLAVAEMERTMIIERTQAGKEMARLEPDFKEGRPKEYTQSQLDWAISLLKENSYTITAKLTGISKSTLIREMKKQNLTIEKLREGD